MRGSIPAHWSQDIAKIAKPPIGIDLADPYAETAGAQTINILKLLIIELLEPSLSLRVHVNKRVNISGKHFGDLLWRFGSPIVVVNLVKKREKKKHESILTEEYTTAIKTLNQFLPPKDRIFYVGFDMARTNKT